MRGDGSAGDSSGLRNGSGARQEGSLAGDAPSGRAPGASTDPEPHSETASPRDPRINWDDLVALAHHMTQLSYCPYSHYRVGAAGLAADGRVVRGCNVENAAYGVALCAECGLVSDLVAGGGGRLLAFVCVDADGAPIMPCGRCRQLLWEHGGPDLLVWTPKGVMTMADVLPQAFDVTNLGKGVSSPGTLGED
ncbi:MAG: cytidine deaminase [Cutibacterium granulosum]|nr:MAG: cytidine deaminase [Cutibacterium granulosum]